MTIGVDIIPSNQEIEPSLTLIFRGVSTDRAGAVPEIR
jgi:hypothetical protein